MLWDRSGESISVLTNTRRPSFSMPGATQRVNIIKSLSFRNAESLQASETCGVPLCDTYHGACMQWRLDNCSQTYTVHLCQGTGVTVLIGYPSTCHFPASQRLPPATILSHLFLPSRPNFLSKSSPPSQPITHILHHTKLALTYLKPSFSHLDLRKALCIHCLLLTTEPL